LAHGSEFLAALPKSEGLLEGQASGLELLDDGGELVARDLV
jgi:hypothetical protein